MLICSPLTLLKAREVDGFEIRLGLEFEKAEHDAVN